MIGSVVMCGDEPVSAGGVRIGSTIAYIGVISAICRAWVRVATHDKGAEGLVLPH